MFKHGQILVRKSSAFGKSWSLITNGYSVQSGWSGGDHLLLTLNSEPYSSTNTDVPLLPVQLPFVKTFVDIELSESVVHGRMITVSTTSSDYFPCELIFTDGRLTRAEVKGIERWTYSDYNSVDPFPGTIMMERLFDEKGAPQVRMECKRLPVDSVMANLDALITEPSIQVVDIRTDPPKQFIYYKGKGLITDQARSGVPMISNRRPQAVVSGLQLSVGAILVLSGLSIILLISVWKLVSRLRRTAS